MANSRLWVAFVLLNEYSHIAEKYTYQLFRNHTREVIPMPRTRGP